VNVEEILKKLKPPLHEVPSIDLGQTSNATSANDDN